MPDTHSGTNPIFVIAAIAVIIFSAVGVGVMTGYIPSSMSKDSELKATGPSDVSKSPAAPAPAPERKVAASAPRTAPASSAPRRSVSNEPVRVATAPSVCANCGRVEAVNAIEQKGEGSGLGAIAGGVVGGVLGNQVGSGRGRTAATVVGAGAGAYAGHEIEKYAKKTQRYDVVVRLEDGTARTFSYQNEPAFRAGDRVKVVEGALVAN
jgi:outer membrane lipoprotein SlyB